MQRKTIILSKPKDRNVVSVPKQLSANVDTYQLLAIRFIYDCFQKKLKGCILQHDNCIKYELEVVAFISATIKLLKGSILIVCKAERLYFWLYYFLKYVNFNVGILNDTNINNLLENEEAAVFIAVDSNWNLLQSHAKDLHPACVIIDELDAVANKRMVTSLKSQFFIGITLRNFARNPDLILQWNMLKLIMPKEKGKYAEFENDYNYYKENLIEPFSDIWFTMTWNFCESMQRPPDDLWHSYIEEVNSWTLKNAPQLSESSKRKRPPVKTALNAKRKRNCKPCELDWTSDEDEPVNLEQLFSRIASQNNATTSKKVGGLRSLRIIKKTAEDITENKRKEVILRSKTTENISDNKRKEAVSSNQTIKRWKSDFLPLKSVITDSILWDEFSKPFADGFTTNKTKSKSFSGVSSKDISADEAVKDARTNLLTENEDNEEDNYILNVLFKNNEDSEQEATETGINIDLDVLEEEESCKNDNFHKEEVKNQRDNELQASGNAKTSNNENYLMNLLNNDNLLKNNDNSAKEDTKSCKNIHLEGTEQEETCNAENYLLNLISSDILLRNNENLPEKRTKSIVENTELEISTRKSKENYILNMISNEAKASCSKIRVKNLQELNETTEFNEKVIEKSSDSILKLLSSEIRDLSPKKKSPLASPSKSGRRLKRSFSRETILSQLFSEEETATDNGDYDLDGICLLESKKSKTESAKSKQNIISFLFDEQ